jgi:hypothetical protein
MTVDIPCAGALVLAALVVGVIIGLALGRPGEPKEATAENYVESKREPQLLDWLKGNKRELTLHRLRSTRSMLMRDFVINHLLTDGEWRKAKQELLDNYVLEVKRGTTATLTRPGSDWVDKQLGLSKQTNDTNELPTGEGWKRRM